MHRPSRNSLTPEEVQVLVENLEEMDNEAFAAERDLVREIVSLPLPGKDFSAGIVLISSQKYCGVCRSELKIRSDRPSFVTLYDDQLGTLPATHLTKYCRKSGCSFQQHYNYSTLGDASEVTYDISWRSLPYFMSSRETAFTVDMLQRLDAEILIGQISYKQRTDIYNNIHSESTGSRKKLDRRRLETAHFRYAMLMVAMWYEDDMDTSLLTFSPDINQTMLKFIGVYHKAFHMKYSAHRCDTKGCGSVLVIDGNMKNRRDVCAAKHAGFVEYEGLPGKVNTGCMETPEQCSKFCTQHKPRQSSNGSHDQQGKVMEMILDKKLTRNTTFYQVLWLGMEECNSTWEQSCDVPAALIAEFDHRSKTLVVEGVENRMGQSLHVLKTTSTALRSQPIHRTTRPVNESSTGHFAETEAEKLQCNTEKDKVKLHHRTAGILGGMWPCGIITLLDELYIAESKSQVYGSIHSLMHSNPASTSNIKFICYDDACHLRKFAQNSTRRHISELTERIASIEITLDRFHYGNHTDEWCKRTCNPDNFDELNGVDTEICEQTFSWLSHYARITTHMNKSHFLFYVLYLSDLHNRNHISKP